MFGKDVIGAYPDLHKRSKQFMTALHYILYDTLNLAC